MSQVLTAAQMRAAEAALIADGDSVDALMERAGAGAAEWVWRICAGRAVTVLCGPGNNGGDGYVIARILAERGVPVSVVAPLAPASDAAKAARARWGGEPVAQAEGDVLVDCLFGTGLSRPLSDDLARLLAHLAGSHSRCVAVDLPSGVDCDTGDLFGRSLARYDVTLALGAWKPAHWLMDTCDLMGERRLVSIGIDQVAGAGRLLQRPNLQAPPRNSHKYDRGLLAVVGGAMPGAGLLAARAAMRGGAGYVKLLVAERPDGAPDDLVVDARPLTDALDDPRIHAALIGPGLGRDAAADARLDVALASGVPLVIDADALHLLTPERLHRRSAPLIVTPHAGELAAVCKAFGVAAEGKVAQATALAAALDGVVIAKGPDTLVAGPDGALVFTPAASSWLSIAGTGDVLAGVVASQFAAGKQPMRAAENAVWLHGEAARIAGPVLVPNDLIAALPATWRACR
ncbi:NAD(P)H-hydrate dehydratase [Croceibacterium sp. TMG7-5b_MA50]|uniref:NAD(P)H-hydrate dehydratase n=1 Tax=Croceibacterium sp. TMG7-5b_MA50 TaxID=3121290 RepID=UPI003221FF0D